MKLRLVVCCICTVWLFGFKISFAQVASKDVFELSLEELLNVEITTATQRSQKLSDAPAAVISYSAEQIESFGWRDLKDIFRNVTGVDVSYDVQGEVKSLVTFRGIEGNQKILILQDGQRQNPITGERFIFGHNIPLHIYKRVEIVFGPASALYGADAYAGVVNLITKDGKDIDGMAGAVGYASTGAVVSSLTFGKAIDENIDILLSGRVYYGEDFPLHRYYKDSVDYGAVNRYEGALGRMDKSYPIKNWNLLGKVKYGRLTLGFDWQHQLESNSPSMIPSNYAYVEDHVWGQDVRHLYFNYGAYRSTSFNLDATVSVGDYVINPMSNFYIPIDSDHNGLLDLGDVGYKYGYSGYAEGNVKADWIISDRLNAILGVTYSKVTSFPKTQNLNEPFHVNEGLRDNLSFFVDSMGYTFGLLGLTDSIFGERNYHNVAAYMQLEYKPVDRITITFGSRYDYNSIYKSTFNPRFGLVYKLSEKFTLKALYGSAFIAPSNYYRWENWANPYAMHIPNLDIKPEKIQTLEVGGSYYLLKNLSFRFSFYRNNMKDIIRAVAAAPQANNYPYYNPVRLQVGENPHQGFVETNTNLGRIYSQGAEFDVNYQVTSVLFSMGYSFTDGFDRETDAEIPKVSQHKISSSVSYSCKNFLGTLTARYYGDVSTAKSNSYYSGTSKIPSGFILYTNMAYRISKNVSMNLSIDNLLNTKHWNASPYAESIWIQPRAPQSLRKVYVGIVAKF